MGGGLRKVVSPLLDASLLELENIMWELVQDLGKTCQRRNTGNRNVDENVCVGWGGVGSGQASSSRKCKRLGNCT